MTNNLKAERTLTAEERVSDERMAVFLANSLKPDEISGSCADMRTEELLGWFRRYFEGNANPKWLKAHAAELAYALQHLRLQSLSTQQPMGEPVAYEVTDKLTSFEHNRVRYIGADDNWLPSARLDTQRFSLRPLYALHPNQESGE